MQNEICRMRLDAAMLDELVREYCIYRGIVESGSLIPSSEILTSISFHYISLFVGVLINIFFLRSANTFRTFER